MTDPTSHQRLLLELLVMTGDVAVRNDIGGTILGRNLEECRVVGWISVRQLAAGFDKVSVTTAGRAVVASKPASGTEIDAS